MREAYNKFIPVVVLFILVNAAVFIFRPFLELHCFGIEFLLIANLILFLVSFFGFIIQTKALHSININAFIRGVYLSLLMKIFIVIIVLGLYLFITRGKVNKPSLFTSMGLYIFYTVLEVMQLMKISRKKPNA
jgi:hypothetical protein